METKAQSPGEKLKSKVKHNENEVIPRGVPENPETHVAIGLDPLTTPVIARQ
jgi:hypothetical protein